VATKQPPNHINARVQASRKPAGQSTSFKVTDEWSVSMHYFQNKFIDRASMKRTMKQPPQCMSFILTFPKLGKAFNYCKMIGSYARW